MRMLNTLIKSWKRWTGREEGVHSLEGFKLVLRRERDRADRSNTSFSMIVFNVQDLSMGELHRFLRAANKRVRLSDEVGWFDERRVGFILPETAMSGANVLSQDIACILASLKNRFSSTVYSYPSVHWNDTPAEEKVELGGVLAKPVVSEYPTPVWKRAMDVLRPMVNLTILLPILISIFIV